jgi:hypothetical protein
MIITRWHSAVLARRNWPHACVSPARNLIRLYVLYVHICVQAAVCNAMQCNAMQLHIFTPTPLQPRDQLTMWCNDRVSWCLMLFFSSTTLLPIVFTCLLQTWSRSEWLNPSYVNVNIIGYTHCTVLCVHVFLFGLDAWFLFGASSDGLARCAFVGWQSHA